MDQYAEPTGLKLATAAPVAAPDRAAAATARRPSSYVRYLEGLRGLAALDVVLYHIWGHTLNSMPLTGNLPVVRVWMQAVLRGRVAVDIFIVLSGYLLMRPVARSPDGKLAGGVWAYLKRRSWRILPPYYAALALALLLEFAIPALQTPLSVQWNDSLPPFGTSNIVAHLLMVHNLSYHWASKIDSPMWTVATEWQIYFVFPLLLLPVWRAMGTLASVSVGLIAGLGFFFLVGGHAAAPWYVGLFAFGMAAAARERAGHPRPYDRPLFAALTFGLFALYVLTGLSIHYSFFGHERTRQLWAMWSSIWPIDVLIGAATACLIAYISTAVRESTSWLARVLSYRWFVRLGVVSYTLYLIHDPFLAIMKLAMIHLNLGVISQFVLMIVVGLPIILLITYGFHLIFEKPFMSARRVHGAESNPAA